MRIVIQRVKKASVTIDNHLFSSIGNGLLVLVGITHNDTQKEADYLARKISNTRIFNDENGIMNKSVLDVNGEILVVSQFTLYANTKKGNRPSYIEAASPETAKPLYQYFVSQLKAITGKSIQTGLFGAHMVLDLQNDGPVTIIMET
jgi:D-tyrosyl-tRNA(Tyr) deacylase